MTIYGVALSADSILISKITLPIVTQLNHLKNKFAGKKSFFSQSRILYLCDAFPLFLPAQS
jgi:hypothetical protein